MRLKSLTIRNYRSLRNIKIDQFSDFNILVGRNNAGKSSVLNAIKNLSYDVSMQTSQPTQGYLPWREMLSIGQNDPTLYITLCFEMDLEERHHLFPLSIILDPEKKTVITRLLDTPLLRSADVVFYLGETGDRMNLVELSIPTEDGSHLTLFSTLYNDVKSYEPFNEFTGEQELSSGAIIHRGVTNYTLNSNLHIPSLLLHKGTLPNIVGKIVNYLSNSFYFSSIRTSIPTLTPQETLVLMPDGSNLAQTLVTVNLNRPENFKKIQEFMQDAVPEIGRLETRMEGGLTYVSFRGENDASSIRLHEMGGGVEQMLLVAIALHSQSNSGGLFLEEPESHLHPGAQRFLFERLLASSRQIFLTTHSPTFLNTEQVGVRIYRVSKNHNVTQVIPTNLYKDLSDPLKELGVRNSDVLLSDAVLFVEGQSDSEIFTRWGEAFGLKFNERNLRIIHMNGGADAASSAPIRSELLEKIMAQAAVPHLLLLDRDHRSLEEINKLERALGSNIHILERREIENYLLSPSAILSALTELSASNQELKIAIEFISGAHIERIIDETVDNLYSTVLIKRIRNVINNLNEGFLTRDDTNSIILNHQYDNLETLIISTIKSHIEPKIEESRLKDIIRSQKEILDSDWLDQPSRINIVPGTDILEEVFRRLGAKFRKTRDAQRIAKHMRVDEISQEIQFILERLRSMSNLSS